MDLETVKREWTHVGIYGTWLIAEVERLKAENFALATHQCKYPTGDDYGHPQCLEIEKLREALEKTRTYLEERGIRHRGVVGRTQILPMIDKALKEQ